ncbi:MAG: PEP-utilizing enzyme [Rectinema sp.]|jgi:pyruvate,water dikinase|uniref:PEP-utilising enzyme, mobile region n=1 Tax=uncultured spirochete TaxID=156406 RepID=A0A3P3XNT5_9SPIR|nr:PEP-utilising enzyme, mobile region [uncultured spirochete]
MDRNQVLARFFGDKEFPVEWVDEEEKKLFWWFDDNHCPNPVSPMYFSLDGWWGPTCEYMYRRFDMPMGVKWPAKRINGYVYTAIVPRSEEEEAATGSYYSWVMPTYAKNFLSWWKDRYVPEVKNNFAYIDNFDAEHATLPELMVHLEEMIDIQERHFRLHWILNYAQFQVSTDFGALVKELFGDVPSDLLGKVNISRADRNWDGLRELWKLKEKVKSSEELSEAFKSGTNGAEIRVLLQKTKAGSEFLKDVQAYANEFGYKSIYTHEYRFKLWVEDNTPVIEQIKNYFDTNYDYNKAYNSCIKEQDDAIAELRKRLASKSQADKDRFEQALDLNLRMMPLTPDHHFYFDQSTYARMRIVLLRVARKMVKEGILDDPEDIMYLEYEQLRRYIANPKTYDGRGLIKKAKAEMEKASKIAPRPWVGTVTNWGMYMEPYHMLWGYPERFEKGSGQGIKGEVKGLAASPGIAEGVAHVVHSPAEFDSVKKGEILVCVMTNPAWVVVFSKIAGIVTDAGGVLSHSAITAREFMIPGVVGTSNATKEIKTGDKVRVDGSTGVVEIL